MNNTLLANPSKLNMQTRPCFAAGKSVVLCLRKKPLRVIQAHQKKTQSDPLWKLEVTQPEDGRFKMTRGGNEETPTFSKSPFPKKM